MSVLRTQERQPCQRIGRGTLGLYSVAQTIFALPSYIAGTPNPVPILGELTNNLH